MRSMVNRFGPRARRTEAGLPFVPVCTPIVSCLFQLGCWMAASLVFAGGIALAQENANHPPSPNEEAETVREIFVPFEALDVLLENDVQRVFLKRDEYENLLRRAKRAPAELPPREALVSSAEYDVTIGDGRATIRGRLDIQVLAAGLHALPLELSGVGVRRASIDGRPAALGRNTQQAVTLFVEGIGQHRVELELTTALQTTAAQQSLQFQVPTPPATRLRLKAPGNVEVRSGAAVAERTVADGGTETRFELLPKRGPQALVLSLNNRQLLQQRLVVARSVMVGEVTQAYQRLHATVSMAVLHGAVDRLRFELPDGFEVTDVGSLLLSRWEVAPGNGDGEPRTLEVTLREPTTETVVVSISAVAEQPAEDDWTLPRLTPLDVASHVAVLGLLVDERLSVAGIGTTGLTAINNQVLRSHLPPTVFDAAPGAPRVREVVAYYAPDADFSLSAQFLRPPTRLSAVTHWLLLLGDERLTARGGFTLTPSAESLFFVDIVRPDGWTMDEVTASDGTALPFEEIESSDGEPVGRVRLPKGIAPGESFDVLFSASSVPAGWLNDWSEREARLPVFRVLGTDHDRGAIAVQTSGDLSVRPQQIDGLLPLDANEKAQFGLSDAPTSLAYRYDAQPYSGLLQVTRNSPWITARTFNFLRIEPQGLTAHYELLYEVSRARTQRLEFTLPASTPSVLSIRGLDGVEVKEYRSEVEDDLRRWTVLLADRRVGQVRLAVDWQQPLPSETPRDWQLPLARTAGVEYQSAIVAVEGSADFDVELTTDGRKVDVGELADANRQVGPRLLGAFGFFDRAAAVTADIFQRPSYGLPAAIIQRAELVTLAATTGRCQTAARYILRTKATYLEIALPDPDRTKLWSATVDGVPAAPQRDGDRLLLSLPTNASAPIRDLQIVYESPGNEIVVLGAVQVAAPRLMVRNEGGDQRYEVPTADVKWTVVLPSGHRILRSEGGVELPREDASSLEPAFFAGKALFVLAGGIRPWFVLQAPLARYDSARARIANDSARVRAYEAVDESSAMPMEGAMFGDTGESPSATAPQPTNRPNVAQSRPAPAAPAGGEDEKAADTPQAAERRFGLSDTEDLFGAAPATQTAANAELEMRSRSRSSGGEFWALEGVRSLLIQIQDRGERVEFQGMRDHPRLQMTLVQDARLRFLGWGTALLVFLIGLTLVGQSVTWKARYVIGCAVLALVLPMIIGAIFDLEIGDTLEPAFYAACLLVPTYLLIATWRWTSAKLLAGVGWVRRHWSSFLRATATALLLLAAGTSGGTAAFGQGPTAEQVHDLLDLLRPPAPVRLPDDAVIIPYGGEGPRPERESEQVLVPYQRYVELWKLAYPDQPLGSQQPRSQFAWAGSEYATTLADADSMTLRGKIEIDVFVDEAIDVPLRLRDAVLTRVVIDGQPARIRVVVPDASAQQLDNQQQTQSPAQPGQQAEMQVDSDPFANPPATGPAQQVNASPAQQTRMPNGALSPSAIAVVRVQGRGRHAIEVSLQLRIARSGGWRSVSGIVPSAPATAFSMVVPISETEVRLNAVKDRTRYETEREDQPLETTLGPGGLLELQWRPKVAVGQIDQSLTARSTGVFDIREDGLRLTWRLRVDMGATPRDTLTLLAPEGWLVESVLGDNVRSWQASGNAGGDGNADADADDDRRIEVTMLKAAAGQQLLTLRLSQRKAIGKDGPSAFLAPAVVVPGAVLHQGHLAIRRSPRLDVRSESVQGVARADVTGEVANVIKSVRDESPLGIRPFQSFRFSTPEYAINLTASVFPRRAAAEIQALLRIGQRELDYEARIRLRSPDRPLHEIRVLLPSGLELERVEATGVFESAVTEQDDRQLLTVYLATGFVDGLSVVISGRIPKAEGDAQNAPNLVVQDMLSQRGHLVVQTDPALAVSAEQLQGCRETHVGALTSWLTPQQRSLARIALSHSSPEFQAVLRTRVVEPVVEVVTISNVRVTLRDVEETMFLRFQVQKAGVREVVFRVPARMAEADVKAPFLRRTSVDPVEGDPEHVRIRVELQDEITGELVVLVQYDQALSDEVQSAPLPTVETGTTLDRYVVLENVGRDEVIVDETSDVAELRREDPKWRMLSGVLGDKITRAFIATGDAVAPRLAYRTQRRSVVETAGASIRLSETVMAVDADGVYRASQIYRLDNQTEQALEIELPPGANLWTVTVAGQPVKPTETPGASSDRFVRIPLIKTAPGDLDFPVALKYGGRLTGFSALPAIEFPLIRTVNVNVELSQARLYLPKTQRFFDFGGTMRRAVDEGDLQAGYLAYRNRQLETLLGVLSGSSSEVLSFSRMRASANLKQLTASSGEFGNQYGEYRSNERVRKQLATNSMIIRNAERQLAEEESRSGAAIVTDNRARFAEAFESQRANRAKGLVKQLGNNFDIAAEADKSKPDDPGAFNQAWLDDSGLNAADAMDFSFAEPSSSPAMSKRLLAGKAASAGVAGTQNTPQFGGFAKKFAGQTVTEAEPSRRSELRQQLERYQSQLDEQSMPQIQARSGLQAPSDASGLGMVPSREAMPAQDLSVGGLGGRFDGGAMGGGGFGGGGFGRGGAIRGDAARGLGQGMPSSRTANADGALPEGEIMLGEAAAVAADSGLTSLDVELPVRGDVFLFTTPGGDLAITARSVGASQVDYLWQIGAIALGLFALWIVYRFLRLIYQRLSRRIVAALLIVTGTLSLVSGVFPIAGLAILLLGIALLAPRGRVATA